MEKENDFRGWDELIPDTLGLIFKNLSLEEVLTVIPRVCKSWGRVVMGPYCWQEIDIEEWSRNCQPELLDRMLRMLIFRSCGSMRKLCVSGLSGDPSFSFIVDHAKSLKTLRLPRSEISSSIVEQLAGKLTSLTFLDLSYCRKIGGPALEAIGKNCKLLTGLRRTMHPLEAVDRFCQDDEALAIASTMPKLKHLEIAYLLVNTKSVISILTNCKELELLDLRGCWKVHLDDKFVKKFSGLKFVGPRVDSYDMNGWDNWSDYSGSSGYLAWDFVAGEIDDDDDDDDDDDISDGIWEDEQNIEDVEMWFYDGVFSAIDAGSDWPPSP